MKYRKEIEDDAEQILVAAIRSMGGYSFKLKFIGMAGAPDRIVFLPGARVEFVELKRAKGGKLENSQEVLFPKLERLGFKIHIVYGTIGVHHFINQLKGQFL